MNMLARNRRLLWFSFLMFLTFLVSIGTGLYIRFISETSAFHGVLNPPVLLWTVLAVTMAFMENFMFFYLAAGLIICVSQIPRGNSVTLREGLSRPWDHKRSLAGWSLIGAFLWILTGPFTCGFYLVTLFALPAMVLDNRDLVVAIRESVLMFRRIWLETYVSFGIILLVTIGLVLVTLFSLGQAAFVYGGTNGGIPDGMISLVVSVLMAIGLVVMGIATCILYMDEKTRVSLDR